MKRITEAYNPDTFYTKKIINSKDKVFPDVEGLNEWYNNYSNNHINRLSFDLQYLIEEFASPNGKRILEIGSIPPILTLAMEEQGYNVTGFDVDPSRFNQCIQNNSLNIVKGKLGNGRLLFEDGSFDAIIMNEVFEHLNSNLIEIFKELFRILRPGGKLFISTPNLKSLVGIRNFLFKGKAYSCCGEIYEEYDKIKKYGHMGHVREYTPTELILFLRKFDLNVIKLIYRGKYPIKYRVIELFLPRLKPFFSVIAEKK